MKITDVETILLAADLPACKQWRWNGGAVQGWTAAFIRVHTDQRAQGVGEVYFGAFVPEMVPPAVENLKKLLIGEDPFNIGYLWRKMNQITKFWNRHGFGQSVIAGIDIALHDLIGNTTGLPVYQMLGGLYRPRVRAYASGGCSDSVSVLTTELRQARAAGWRGYKWRLVEPEQAGPIMQVLREEAGPDFDLMVDLVQGSAPNPWSNATVLEIAESLDPYRPCWLEEPYAIEDRRAYRELRGRIRCPIAGGEGISSLEEARQFMAGRAVDILQPDATIAGGLTLCKYIGAVAFAQHIDIASHSWGGAGSLLANLHFGLANPSSRFVEYCCLESPFLEHLLQAPLRMEDGYLYPPHGPGLGMKLSDDVINRYPYKRNTGHEFHWEDAPVREASEVQ